MNLNYIITETSPPDSFDPLLADKGNNILMMRMLYFTPLQINSSNELISNVLEHFEYNPNNFTIKFLIKKQLGNFSDGTEFKSNDVLMAILRMAYSMPNFPVIKDIVGVHEWVAKKEGLTSYPDGISINNNEIQIKLTRHNSNALFRFCLELFSIIPSKCIDLNTGKLICKTPAYSGYYELAERMEKEYKFKLRLNQSLLAETVQYKNITFQYKNFAEVCDEIMSENTIIAGTDMGLNSAKCSNKFKQEQIHWLQASRFGAVLFNPNVKPFNTALSRRFYADKIRDYFYKHNFDLIITKSIFTELLPGYLDNSKFPMVENNFKPDKNITIKLNNVKSIVGQNVTNAIKEIAIENNLTTEIHNDDIELNTANFLSSKIGYMLSGSGFWPQDPIGDLSMYFTKNLHSSLHFVWQDKKIYTLTKEIEDETDPSRIKLKMENFNHHLYVESLIAPIVHFRRLYITHNSIKSLNLPMAVTSPAPWHLMPTE